MLQLDTHLRLTFSEIQKHEAEIDEINQDHPADLLRAGTVSAHRVAVAGVDGYLFIGDGANKWEKQFNGEAGHGSQWTRSWIKVLEDRRRTAERLRVQLINLIIPEKQVILPHKRWPEIDVEFGAKRPMRMLLASARLDLRLVYPVEALERGDTAIPSYSRHDSHWGPSGCCAAMQTLLTEIGGAPGIHELAFLTVVRHIQRDLTAHFFVKPVPEYVLRLEPNGIMEEYNNHAETSGQFTGAYYKLVNPHAPDKRRVAVFGDSYSFTEGVTYVLSAAFETVFFLWSKDVDWDLVRSQTVDVVIWEHAERFMTLPSLK